MKKNTAFAVLAAVATMLLVTTGCTRVQQGAAAGGVLGATVGGIAGHNGGHLSTWEGALVGGATGAAVGGLAGDAYEQMTEEDKARHDENLRAQLADAEREIARLRAELAAAGDTSDLEKEIERLRQQLRDAEARANRQPPSDSELQQRVDELNRQLAAERARNAANERNLNEMRRLLGDLCSRLETLNMSMQGGGNQPTQPANVSQYGAQSIQPQQ